MTARTMEARLVISGEDKGASAMVEKVTKAVKEFAKDADMSAAMRKAADEATKAEKAFNAVNKAMSGREGFAKAQADVKTAEATLAQYTKQLDAARQAKAAFTTKPMKGSEEAAAYAAATKALREMTTAHRAAEREVAKTTGAMHAQSAAMREADSAAAHLGADLGNLEAHQRRLRASFEANTAAIAKQVALEERAAKASQARQARMDAWKGAAGIVGLSAVHKAEHFAGHALHTYQHFDNERRFGKVVMDLTDEQQKPLVDQAIHMGAISRYNDVKVLHAQRELAARGLNRDQILGMIPHVKDLGQALDIDIGEAAKMAEAGIFAFKKDISSLSAATKSAQQTADVQVKAAKISGMTPEDIKLAYKYGATPARLAHVSEERMLAFAGVLKKATIGGDESGVAFRALMSMTNAPTAGAKVAMRAAGLDYNNYQKKPEKLAVDPFVKQVAESYGVKLDGTVQAGLRKIFSNKEIIGDSTKFTPAVMELLSDNLGGDDAKSKKSIAGLANRYRNASMGGVDSNRLIDDLLVKLRDNLAFANALFGSKQGGRIATALSDPETFTKMQMLLGGDKAAGYAAKVSEARMEGFDGAVKRFEGAVTNLETKLGRAWDNDGKGGALTDLTNKAGQFVQHLAEMDNAVIRVGTVFAAVGSGFVALKSLGLLQSGFGLKTSAAALDHSAIALEAAAVKLAGGNLGSLPGGGPDKGSKGSKLKGALGFGANVVGALALEPLAEEAQRRHILEMPNLDDGLLRSGLNFLDPNLGNKVLGDRAKAIPSMAIRPGEVPLTLGGSGLNSFGLTGGMSPEEIGKRDADRYSRGLVEARRNAAPLNPGDELPGLGPEMVTKAQEKGTEAGQKAGDGIKQGLSDKAPEVEQQGQTILQRLQQMFSAGIFVPIHLQPGEGLGSGNGASGVQAAGFGGGGAGGGLIHRANFGGGGGGGAGGGGPSGPMPAIPASVQMSASERNELGLITKYEAGGRNVPNYINDRTHTAQGFYQITNTNWRRLAPKLGISARNAMAASLEDQTRVALALRRESGMGNWTRYNPRLRGALGRGETVPAVKDGAALDPHLVRAPDGREGLDLGNGKMRMPDGSIQPISNRVPDPPSEGAAEGARADFGRVADRMHAAAERFEQASFHGQISVSVSGDQGARARGMRIKSTGAVSADMGISMRGAKDDMGDWV